MKDAPRVTSGAQLEALADVELRDNVDVALIEDQRVTPHSRLPDLDEAEMHVSKARGSTARKHPGESVEGQLQHPAPRLTQIEGHNQRAATLREANGRALALCDAMLRSAAGAKCGDC